LIHVKHVGSNSKAAGAVTISWERNANRHVVAVGRRHPKPPSPSCRRSKLRVHARSFSYLGPTLFICSTFHRRKKVTTAGHVCLVGDREAVCGFRATLRRNAPGPFIHWRNSATQAAFSVHAERNHCHDTLGFRASTIGRGSFLFCVAVMTPRRFPPPWSVEDIGVAFFPSDD
jgi:hypothetical protein